MVGMTSFKMIHPVYCSDNAPPFDVQFL